MTAGHRPYVGADLEALADLPHYQRWIADLFGSDLRGRLVEIGAGIGNVSAALVDRVASATLIEPDPALAGRLSARFAGDAHVQCVTGTLDDAVACGAVQDRAHDAIAMVNVLEHIEDDVGVLRVARTLLSPDGALLLFVPALPLLHGALDRAVGHVRRYTRRSLRRAVEGAGFTVERLHYVDGLGVLPWFVYGRVLNRSDFDSRSATLYDRVAVPVVSRLERVIPPVVGKNLVCVARPRRDVG